LRRSARIFFCSGENFFRCAVTCAADMDQFY
jgi:hypothetical protein